MTAIYKRELKSYFYSMTGCIFIAVMTLFAGIYFMAYNLVGGYPYFSYALGSMLFLFLIAVPILTMRSFAEEQKSKTDQLLLTSPVSVGGIVWGKYLAMVSVHLITCLTFCVFPLIINSIGTAYLKVDYVAIFLFFLLGCVYISIGMFLSSLTESQIIASISTFGILLILYLWSGILEFLPSGAAGNLIGVLLIWTVFLIAAYQMTKNWILCLGLEVVGIAAGIIVYVTKQSWLEDLLTEVFGNLVLTDVFINAVDGSMLDVSGIVLYLTLIGVFLFLTVQSIQKKRFS